MSDRTTGPIKLREDSDQYSCDFIAADSVGKGYYGSICSVTQRDPHPIYGGGISRATTKANAERIVACWNACEGISTEDLQRISIMGGMVELARSGGGDNA